MAQKAARLPATLTEAAAQASLIVMTASFGGTSSNARHVPYAELYRGRTAIMETPAEYLQRAAEDEEQRQVEEDQ